MEREKKEKRKKEKKKKSRIKHQYFSHNHDNESYRKYINHTIRNAKEGGREGRERKRVEQYSFKNLVHDCKEITSITTDTHPQVNFNKLYNVEMQNNGGKQHMAKYTLCHP